MIAVDGFQLTAIGAAVLAGVGSLAAASATFYLAVETRKSVEITRASLEAAQTLAVEASDEGKRERAIEARAARELIERQARLVTVWTRPGSNYGVAAGVETTIHYRNASDAPIHELHVDVSMSVGKGCCDLHTVGPGDSGNRLVSLDATETPADQLEQATVEYRFQDAALRAWLVRNGEYHGPD
jgi:hypothetical protein